MRKSFVLWVMSLALVSGLIPSRSAHAFCDPPNLLIVLDRSGSMVNANKWNDAKSAINSVTSSHGTKIRMGLETFSDNATINAPIPSTSTAIQTALNALSPLGQTFMVKAMTTARSHIISVLNADSQKGRPTSILFITDGAPSDRCPTAEVSALRSLKVGSLTYDVKTYVIGFGSLANPPCLNDMATRGGTALSGSIKYYVANNASGLLSAMNTIIASALKKKPEVCDGKDNDCDGQVDENLKRSCANNKCRGTETCQAGQWKGCTAATPKTEVCDGKDNDCDGQTDESLTRPCTYKCGSKTLTGTERCSAGKWVSCTARPRAESCNNNDDDCDGQIDEGLNRSCTKNGCRGTESCSAGKWVNCNAPAPKTEICDNKDNDCDGKIDENVTQACTYNCAGTIRNGTETCSRGRWYNCTARPTSEKCDNIDNDCDGSVDEGLVKSCYDSTTRCRGTSTCKAGKYGSCVTAPPAAESCNNKDDDCDGSIDEGLTRPCTYKCAGKDRTGTERCSRGRWVSCTARPTSERCDGVDNDCDGKIDENMDRSCTDSKTKCRGISACKNGKYEPCNAPAPVAETCNKKDDDCDGRIDESLTRACTRPCGSGQITGTERCSNGTWYGCTARPTAEVCDNKDNDCDGQTDENLTKSCGKCGTSTCSQGKWGTCIEAKKTPEVCDNKDNDCDGKIDEDLKNPCKYKNCVGQQICSRGRWSSCQPPPELCNGKDDDCDGKIDENWPDKGRICGTGLGICYRTGKFTCKADGSGLECDVVPGRPEPEVCDAKDNDCDGKNDEGLKRPCNAKCVDGTQECKEGSWATCVANPGSKPPPEVCDGKDNNCDGKIDEGCGCPPNATRPCGEDQGTCKPGTQSCVNGEWSKECKGLIGPKTEVCNGQDDDCDGDVDEDLYRECTTNCGKGRQACILGDWRTCDAGHPQPEICNGIDDDCDGIPDNGATTACGDGFGCTAGGCRPNCRNGECPGGQQCVDGICVGKTCTGVRCPEGYTCEKALCVDLCTKTTCPPGLLCRRGKCLPKDCYAYGCESGKTCIQGQCEPDPCFNKKCADGQYCRGGSCVDVCDCKDGEICVNDQCVADACKGKQCSDGKVCRNNGDCVKACPTPCHDGQYCKDGQCVHNDCHQIQCPVGFRCFEGQCTNKIPERDDPKNPPDPEGTTPPDGGTTPPDQGSTSPDNGAGKPDNSGPGKEKTVDPCSGPNCPDTGGSGNDGGAGVGCGCQLRSSGGQGLMWMLFFLAFFGFNITRRTRS